MMHRGSSAEPRKASSAHEGCCNGRQAKPQNDAPRGTAPDEEQLKDVVGEVNERGNSNGDIDRKKNSDYGHQERPEPKTGKEGKPSSKERRDSNQRCIHEALV